MLQPGPGDVLNTTILQYEDSVILMQDTAYLNNWCKIEWIKLICRQHVQGSVWKIVCAARFGFHFKSNLSECSL